MIHIAIIEDEKYYREQIEKLLSQYLRERDIEHSLDVFSLGEEFYYHCDNLAMYDIAFLDINLGKINGIDIAYKLRACKPNIYIVFVTSQVDYVFEGYKVDAIRYIMKENIKISLIECMNTIIKKMKFKVNKMEFSFTIGKQWLYLDKIYYIESFKHKLKFKVLEDDVIEYEMYSKLDAIEEEIKEYGFLRIHKSYLVNMKYIKRINNYKAIMINDEELPIPKMRYQSVRETFVIYKGEL